MKIYLARHGRTNYNDLNLCNSNPAVDVHLTPIGIEQAKKLAEQFKNRPVDCIFVSELKRTQQTAEIINELHGLKIIVDARLNDIATGFESRSFNDYISKLAAAPNKWTARFNGGESIEDVKKRVADFISELRDKNYDSVLIITSQWVMYAIIAIIEGITNEDAWAIEVIQGDFLEVNLGEKIVT